MTPLSYVTYVFRKEHTCRRCNSNGVAVLVDCKGAKLSTFMWQAAKLKKMTSFMGKYGEQFLQR